MMLLPLSFQSEEYLFNVYWIEILEVVTFETFIFFYLVLLNFFTILCALGISKSGMELRNFPSLWNFTQYMELG